MLTVGSLFSGIGGLEMGLEACGVGPVRWFAERDPYARSVFSHHWPEALPYTDVRRIDATTERVDVISGGFPCQGISDVGKRRGLEDARSGLWREFVRVVALLRPRLIFVENVASLRRRGLDRVLGDLAGLGFDAEWDCLRAADSGAPHLRRRLFVLAYAPGERLPEIGGPESLGPDPRGSLIVGHGFPPGPGAIDGWSGPQPAVRRGANGLWAAMDRLRCLGNAVVPQQAALAWRTLMTRASRSACSA